MLMLQASRKLVQRFSRPPPAQLRLAAGVGHPVVEQQPPPAANLDQSSEIETNFEPTPSGWMPPRGVYMGVCACGVTAHPTYTGLPAEPGKQYSPDDPNYIPFSVRRSRTNNIAVYQTYKSGRSRVITDIKKIEGDIYVCRTHSSLTRAHALGHVVCSW